MPQIAKGGKFIFGWSGIKKNGSLQLPSMAVNEYKIQSHDRCILFTSSKTTGGFCVTTKALLEQSILRNILIDNPTLMDFTLPEQTFIKYKNKKYGWIHIHNGNLALSAATLSEFEIVPGSRLLSIRSSDIAFTMGAKGPLLEHAHGYKGVIEIY